jgi:hypothetical protein
MTSKEHLRRFLRESEARRRTAMYEVQLVCGHMSFAHASHVGKVPCLKCGTDKEIRFVGPIATELEGR